MNYFSMAMKSALTGIVISLSFVSQVSAAPVSLKVRQGVPNLVTFTSKAPLETIVGKTSAISGRISFDPDNLQMPVEASLEVQMATLDTDNRVRNGHMRENHLHVDRFPTCVFTLTSLTSQGGTSLPVGTPVRLKAEGEFLLHGVKKQIEPEVTAIWDASAKALQIEATFQVKLSDYEIPRPQFLVMKLDETQVITVKFVAK